MTLGLVVPRASTEPATMPGVSTAGAPYAWQVGTMSHFSGMTNRDLGR